MPRFQKPVFSDVGISDGKIWMSSVTDCFATTGSITGAYSTTLGSSNSISGTTATVMQFPLASLLFKSGMQDDLQEQFGGGPIGGPLVGAQGLASPTATFTTPASVSGPPPFTGITQFTSVTAARPKGLQINSIDFIYTITSSPASVNTASVLDFAYTNNGVPVVTTLLASAANGLQTAAQTNPYVTNVKMTTVKYLTAADHQTVVTWSLTPGAGASVYGIVLNVTYNFA